MGKLLLETMEGKVVPVPHGLLRVREGHRFMDEFVEFLKAHCMKSTSIWVLAVFGCTKVSRTNGFLTMKT